MLEVRDLTGDAGPTIVEIQVSDLRKKIGRPYGASTVETVRGADHRRAAGG
jgi:DNA-binding response OmpR family regulator